MMIGTPEEEIEKVNNAVEDDSVINDFDIEEDVVEVQHRCGPSMLFQNKSFLFKIIVEIIFSSLLF